MHKIKTEIIIDAPASRIWEVLTDFASYGEWNPFIVSIEGEKALGARLTHTMVSNGRTRVFKPIIKEFEAEKSFVWLGKLPLGLFTGRHHFRLEAINDQQTKLIHGEVFGGLLRGMIMKKIGEETYQNFLAMNRALKARAERVAISD